MTDEPESPYLFVSYASADRERVLPVIERLEAAGVRTWIDREGIHGGSNYAQVINDAARARLRSSSSPRRLPWPRAMSNRNWRSVGATRSRICRCCSTQ